jgi:acetyl esterase
MRLDAEVQSLLDQFHASGQPPFDGTVPIGVLREAYLEASRLRPKGHEVSRVEDRDIDGPAGPIHVRIYVPAPRPPGLIIYLHGGGFAFGSVEQTDPTVRRLVHETGFAAVSVDYRLAPEHRFPAAVEDCFAALKWAAANMSEITGRNVPLVTMGDSAGGNLATVITHLARDASGPPIDAQVLIYPAVEGDLANPALKRFESALLTLPEMSWLQDHYVPDLESRSDPRFAPLRAESLAGLPPAFILTAEGDLLADEGERYARRLIEAGIPVLQRCYLGTVHGFLSLDGGLWQCAAAFRDIANYLKMLT